MSSPPISLQSMASASSHGSQGAGVQTAGSSQHSSNQPPDGGNDGHTTRTPSHRSVSSISTASQRGGSGPPSPIAQPVAQAPQIAQPAAANGGTVNGQPYRAKRIVGIFEKAFVDYWAYEISAIVICVGTAVGIFAILVTFQNGSSRHVMGGVTINTAVSILANFSRAAIGFVAASAIAQQKWLRFRQKSRSLLEVVLYEEATRGPLGSLFLLKTLQVGFVALFAVLVGILALGFEPFVQQSIRYPSRDTLLPSNAPVFATAQNVDLPDEIDTNRTLLVNAAVRQALYADSVDPVQPNCPGTSCDWQSYSSVAIHHSCEDAMGEMSITPQFDPTIQGFMTDGWVEELNVTNVLSTADSIADTGRTSYNVSLGAGSPFTFDVRFDGSIDIIENTLKSALSFPDTVVWDLSNYTGRGNCFVDCGHASMFANDPSRTACYMKWSNNTINGIKGPVKAFGYVRLALGADNASLVAMSAQRCVFALVANEYSTTLKNASLSTQINQHTFGQYTSIPFFPDPDDADYGGGLQWSASIKKVNFSGGVSADSDGSCRGGYSSLIDYYNALTTLEGSINRTLSKTVSEYWASVYAKNASNNAEPDVMQFMSNIRNNTAKLGQGLTNLIQQSGGVNVKGKAYILATYVEVRWWWLTYPMALIVVGIAALLATMYQTHRHRLPKWKSSPLPLLYNYHDNNACPQLNAANQEPPTAYMTRNTQQEQEAKNTRLRLRANAGVWSFSREP